MLRPYKLKIMALTGRTVFDWIHDSMRGARDAGDTERQRLLTLERDAWVLRETQPDRALLGMEEGRVLAQTLGEAWWVIFFVQRRVSLLLYSKGAYGVALDAAVRAVVEARKPIYNGCPQQLSIHIDLISAYVEVDAAGYKVAIEDALAFVSSQKDVCDDHLFEIQRLRVRLELELEQWKKAHEAAHLYLDLASQATFNLDFYLGSALSQICSTSYRINDWTQLMEHAQNGEVYARRENRIAITLWLQMWQALALHHEGKLEESKRLSRLVADQMRHRNVRPSSTYFQAYAALREARGEWREALALRDHQLAVLKDRGNNSTSARCHFERCRLLSEMGELSRDDVDAAREAMNQLIKPAPMLAKLEKLQGDNEP